MPTETRCAWKRMAASVLLLVTGLIGSAGWTASVESLVMPGPVIGGHADTEETCSACHALFERTSQRGLCLDCHERVAADIDAASGFHGRSKEARTADCRTCHTEHKGRDADIVGLQASLFDHDLTDFPLSGTHATAACASCHEADTPHAEAPTACAGCHRSDDAHDGALGSACDDCHDSSAWRSGRFDHDGTGFALTGAHTDATCLACHADRRFETTGSACIDCHRVDDVHGGRNGTACADCHETVSWDTRFDHFTQTGFPLVESHALLSCRNCHVDETSYEGLPSNCHGCHVGDDVHLGSNGTSCGDCHAQGSWAVAFDHEAETGHALLGTHATLQCASCHSDGLDKPLPVECASCHDGDDPHDGTLERCDRCHGERHWDAELRFSHDLTGFALVGLHRVVSCEQCHDSLVFSPVAHRCLDCHQGEDGHGGSMDEDCAQCHNPSGWSFWSFEHEHATGFALTGAHGDLACAACHPPNRPAENQTQACISCHRGDDVHNGRFGQNCNRCHLSTSFEALKDEL